MRAWKVLTPRSSPAASFAAAVEQGSHDRLDLGPEGDDGRDELAGPRLLVHRV